MIKKLALHRAAAMLLCLFVLGAGPGRAWSADSGAPAEKTSTKKKKARTTRTASAKVRFLPGSQETPAERRARLKLECRDRVNAGACEGYTR